KYYPTIVKQFFKLNYYRPINLFLEEFKFWLIELSNHRPDQDDSILNVVEGRLKYIEQIYTTKESSDQKKIFEGEDQFLHVLPRLKKELKKISIILNNMISRKSAREHFHELQITGKIMLAKGLETLFYIYRNTSSTPSLFNFRQFCEPTFPEWEEC